MSEFIDFFKIKKNLVSVLILGILILALPLGITLLQKQQNIKSRANIDPVVFSGNVEQRNGNWVAFAPQISLELTSPLGPSASRLVELRNSFLGLLEQRLVNTVYAAECSYPSSEVCPNLGTCSNGAVCASGHKYCVWDAGGNHKWSDCQKEVDNCSTQCNNTTPNTPPTGGAGTCDPTALASARGALSPHDSKWQTASCDQLKAEICKADSTLFIDAGSASIRTGICGTTSTTPTGGGSCSSLGPQSAGTITGAVATCIALKMSKSIKDIKGWGHASCSDEQIVNYMCNGGINAGNQSDCLNNKSSCGGGGTTPGGSCNVNADSSLSSGCQSCINTQKGGNLPQQMKDLGSRNGNNWNSCSDAALISEWCNKVGTGECNNIKSSSACTGADKCGGTPTGGAGNCDPTALANARSGMNKAATSNPNATSGPWDNATCDQLKAEICPNPNLFVAPNATRDALCGATNNTPAAPTCNSFLPNGLSDTGQIGTGGIKIYTTTGGRVLLNVSRTPASSTIQPSSTKTPSSASELAIEPATDASGNYFVNIPNNSSTTNDNEYTLSANVTSGGSSVNCTPFIIRVPKQGADNTCPSSISSTQARLKINNQAWTTNGTIDLGDSVTVAGFHNNQTDTAASDVALTVVGPDGPQSHVVSVSGNYTPELPGRYTVTATVVDKNGGSCTGNASLTVNPAKVTTKSYRIAESLADLKNAQWKDYTADGMIIDYDFKTPGQKFIFVEFKDSKGNVGCQNDKPFCQAKIKVLGENPAVTSCNLNFQGNDAIVTMTGRNFGSDKGTVKGNNADLQIKQWKNDSVQVVWPNAPTGEGLDLSVVNPDGQSGQGQCSALSQIALGAKVMCRAPSSYQTTNVDLQIAGAFEGGKVVKQKVSIDQDGIVQGLSQRLEEGKQYTLSIKAPKSLRRNVVFLAAQGTTNIPDFALPVGDIFPAGSGDGKINAFDHDALVRQWNISGDATGRTADFNQDGKVNSLDWSCMRTSMMDSAKSGDDPLPVAGPIATPKTASQSSSLNSDVGSCECDLGDVVSDECITSKTATCNGKFSCVCR